MKDKRKRPRWLQAVKAFAFGYFWVDCPLCGKKFGGQEKENGHLYKGDGGGQVVCANCAEDADKISEQTFKKETSN